MKDYYVIGSREDFVTNYEIKNDNLIIHYSKGKDLIVPYSKKNECEVLRKMRYQVNQFIEEENNCKSDVKGKNPEWIDKQISFAIFVIFSAFLAIGTIGFSLITSFSILCCSLYFTKKFVNFSYQIRELKKIKEFLSREDEINNYLKSNANSLSCLNENQKNYVVQTIKIKENIIDLNTIDNFTLKDLQKIKTDIKRLEGFNFDNLEENEQKNHEEESEKVKVIKPMNNKKEL